MIKYKYLRFIAAIGWGAVAMIMTTCALWAFTQLQVQDIIFYAMLAYFITIGIILWNTEPEPKKKARPEQEQKGRIFCMYNVEKGDWDVRKTA